MALNQYNLEGLYYYLTQVQLSVHRSDWRDFKVYEKIEMPDIDYISTALEASFGQEIRHFKHSKFKKDCFFFDWLPINRELTQNDKEYIFGWFNLLKAYLKSSSAPSTEEVSELRLNLAYAAGILSDKLSYIRKRNVGVTHLNENKNLNTQTIAEILGTPWPALPKIK